MELTSTAEIIDVLGGVAAVAKLTDTTYKAAHNWKSFDRFPPRTYVAITDALRERGLSAPASLWGMVPNAAEGITEPRQIP